MAINYGQPQAWGATAWTPGSNAAAWYGALEYWLAFAEQLHTAAAPLDLAKVPLSVSVHAAGAKQALKLYQAKLPLPALWTPALVGNLVDAQAAILAYLSALATWIEASGLPVPAPPPWPATPPKMQLEVEIVVTRPGFGPVVFLAILGVVLLSSMFRAQTYRW